MSVRLFGRFWPSEPKRVTGIKLRVLARATPADAEARVSDPQLQPGKHITGWTLNSRDLGVQAVEGWQFRNGIVYGDTTLVLIADTPSASPTRWDVARAGGNCRIGDYLLGHVTNATVNGATQTATQGAGIPPHITQRADIDVPLQLEGRAALVCWFRGMAAVDPNEPPPADPDPIDPDAPWEDPDEDDDIEDPPEPETPDEDDDEPVDP